MSREYIARYTKKDFRIDTFSAGGKGGQHQNKTESGVRITHIPSNISVERRKYRSQHMNKKEAFQVLGKLVLEWHKRKAHKEKSISTEVVRTYHEVDNRVTDHLTREQESYHTVLDDPTNMMAIRQEAILSNED